MSNGLGRLFVMILLAWCRAATCRAPMTRCSDLAAVEARQHILPPAMHFGLLSRLQAGRASRGCLRGTLSEEDVAVWRVLSADHHTNVRSTSATTWWRRHRHRHAGAAEIGPAPSLGARGTKTQFKFIVPLPVQHHCLFKMVASGCALATAPAIILAAVRSGPWPASPHKTGWLKNKYS